MIVPPASAMFGLLWLYPFTKWLTHYTHTLWIAKVTPEMRYPLLEFPSSMVHRATLSCICVSYFSFSLFGLLRLVVSSTLSCFSSPCGLRLNNWVVLRQGNKLHGRRNNLLDCVCVRMTVSMSVLSQCSGTVMTSISPELGKQTHVVYPDMLCKSINPVTISQILQMCDPTEKCFCFECSIKTWQKCYDLVDVIEL